MVKSPHLLCGGICFSLRIPSAYKLRRQPCRCDLRLSHCALESAIIRLAVRSRRTKSERDNAGA